MILLWLWIWVCLFILRWVMWAHKVRGCKVQLCLNDRVPVFQSGFSRQPDSSSVTWLTSGGMFEGNILHSSTSYIQKAVGKHAFTSQHTFSVFTTRSSRHCPLSCLGFSGRNFHGLSYSVQVLSMWVFFECVCWSLLALWQTSEG